MSDIEYVMSDTNDDTPKCVHTEHCCYEHGCKYGNDACPVANGFLPASFPCEDCDWAARNRYTHDLYHEEKNYWYSDEDELE